MDWRECMLILILYWYFGNYLKIPSPFVLSEILQKPLPMVRIWYPRAGSTLTSVPGSMHSLLSIEEQSDPEVVLWMMKQISSTDWLVFVSENVRTPVNLFRVMFIPSNEKIYIWYKMDLNYPIILRGLYGRLYFIIEFINCGKTGAPPAKKGNGVYISKMRLI